MKGFFKAAYDAGLSVEMAAELHSLAIIKEAGDQSPEFARGFIKQAGAGGHLARMAARWWQDRQAPSKPVDRYNNPSYYPTQQPTTSEHKGRHAEQARDEKRTAGKSHYDATQSTNNILKGRSAIHNSHQTNQSPAAKLLQASNPLDFRVRTPSGIAAARG